MFEVEKTLSNMPNSLNHHHSLKNIELSIVIPAWNEGKRITLLLDELRGTLPKDNIEIIVVDDGSTDDTYEKVLEWSEQYSNYRLLLLKNIKNSGKGESIKLGISNSNGKFVSFIDADLEIHPTELVKIFTEAKEQQLDIAVGSKKAWGDSSNLKRKIISKGFRLLNRVTLNLSIEDTQTGCKVFKGIWVRGVISSVRTRGFLFDLELIGYAAKSKRIIKEIPIKIERNLSKENRINTKEIFEALFEYAKIIYRIKKTNLDDIMTDNGGKKNENFNA